MSDSPLVTYTRISPNRTSPRRHAIDTVTIHCYVGQVTVESAGAWFAQEKAQASCNYIVDKDGRIGLIVPEGDRSWCSSDADNDHRAVTIEMASESVHPYAVTDAAYRSLIELLADICRRNGIPELRWKGDKSLIGQTDKQNMTVHRWFKNKACPGEWLYSRHGQIAEEVNRKLKGEDEEMDVSKLTDAEILALANRMQEVLGQQEPSDWSQDARDWAEAEGVIKGDENGSKQYKAFVTREQLAVIEERLHG